MPKNWLYIVIIIFGIVVFFVYDRAPQIQSDLSEQTEIEKFPSYFLDDFKTIQFDQSGKLQYQLTANRAEHFQVAEHSSADDYTLIDKPRFTFFQAGESPWHLTSEQGRATENGEIVELDHQVLAWQMLPNDQMAEISTKQLYLYPPRQFADTDQSVVIQYPRARYRGDGMELDFKTQVFTLLTNVKGTHDPR